MILQSSTSCRNERFIKSAKFCFRYGFARVKYIDGENKNQEDVVLFYWAGPTSPLKIKMTATSSFDALKRKCPEAKHKLELNDDDCKEVDFICDKISKTGVKEFEGKEVEKDSRTKSYRFKK